jgi:hypothetical protein
MAQTVMALGRQMPEVRWQRLQTPSRPYWHHRRAGLSRSSLSLSLGDGILPELCTGESLKQWDLSLDLRKYAFPCASIVCCTFFHPSGSNSEMSFFVIPLDVSD